jgi:hypothetical protein
MTKDSILQVLDAEGITAGKDRRFAIPENREAMCLIATPGDVMPVERLVSLEFRETVIVLENAKKERYFFPYDAVLGLRLLGGPAAAARERVAGFGR